jgi:hypothetical protein
MDFRVIYEQQSLAKSQAIENLMFLVQSEYFRDYSLNMLLSTHERDEKKGGEKIALCHAQPSLGQFLGTARNNASHLFIRYSVSLFPSPHDIRQMFGYANSHDFGILVETTRKPYEFLYHQVCSASPLLEEQVLVSHKDHTRRAYAEWLEQTSTAVFRALPYQ